MSGIGNSLFRFFLGKLGGEFDPDSCCFLPLSRLLNRIDLGGPVQ